MATNPLVNEWIGVSPELKTALGQAHQSLTANQNPPVISPEQKQASAAGQQPPPQQMGMPPAGGVGSLPQVGAAPMAPVHAPRGTVEGDTAERARMEAAGPGVSQIYHNITNSRFGQAHPLAGKIIGGGLQGLGTAAEVAGSLFGPTRTAEALIPGTTAHHGLEAMALDRNIANEEKERTEAATQAETQARAGETGARTGLINEQAAELPQQDVERRALEDAQIQNYLHPQAKTAFEDWRQQNPTAPTADFFKAQQAAKPEKLETPQAQVYDDLVARGIPKEKALEMTKERPPTINVNAGNAALDRESTRFAKTYDKDVNDANGQLEKIADAKAMIGGNAEAQALGLPKVLTALVSGQGTGVRITQAELNMIGRARGVSGDLEGWLNRLSGKGQLSRVQQQQLNQILSDVETRITQKAAIANSTLDRINGAGSREEIIQADKEARKQLSDLEKQGGERQRPANVPEGYTYNANGPRGAGWYAPTAK